MALYAIGDLHLHYQSVLRAPGQLHGRVWKNHEEKFRKNCGKLVSEEDTLVLVGDHSWGKNLAACELDLQYIRDLPGRKILTRGNHDMFWDAKKTGHLNELFQPELTFLQDSYEVYRDYALVGTKGFTFEGPFYIDRLGRIIGWDEEAEVHAKKLVMRELQRLRKSFELAKADGYQKFIMFLHYPPIYNGMECEEILSVLKEYGIKRCYYGHIHGGSAAKRAFNGEKYGIRFQLIACDHLGFCPLYIDPVEKAHSIEENSGI